MVVGRGGGGGACRHTCNENNQYRLKSILRSKSGMLVNMGAPSFGLFRHANPFEINILQDKTQ